MALSGSFSGSIKSGNYKLRVDWSATQNVTNNTSKITATMYLVIASGWSLNIASRSGNTAAIAGTSYSWSSPAIDKGGSTTKLGTVTSGNITHNSDGTKSVTLTATFKIQATISGTYYDTITASETVTLNTIPRATTPTLSATSVFTGSNVTITLPRASSSFTHDLAYSFAGGSWVTFRTGATTSHTWTVPTNLSESMPNATAGLLSIRCTTKNGGTTIGTKTVSLTIKVPTSAAYYPTISKVSLTEATAGLAAQFGAYIQNKSKVEAAITAEGAKGSTIKSISTTFQGGTYSGSSWTSGLLSSSGTLSMTTTVTDSRGRTAKKTTTLSVLAYSPPKVTVFDVYRVDSEGETDTEGMRGRVHYAYSVPSLNGGNTAAAVVEYKKTTDTTWTRLFADDDLATNANWFSGGDIFDVDNQYDARLTVTDYFGAKSIFQTMLPSGAVIVDILADGTGLGIGKVAELPGVCDVAMRSFLRGGMRWKELPTGTDLDTLLAPDQFRLTSSGDYKNGPENFVGAMLEILGHESIVQRWTVVSKTHPRCYERSYYGDAWGGWLKVYDVVVNRVYSASARAQITTASVDTRADGAEIEVPAGTYIVTASATFNTGSSSGTRNNEVRLMAGDTVLARERVFAAGANFGELRTTAIYTATATTKLKCQKSSSITELSNEMTTVTAVRLY